MDSQPQLVCRFCADNFTSLPSYMSHLKLHRHICNSGIPCCIRGCKENFNLDKCLRIHLFRHHSVQVTVGPESELNQTASNSSGKFICTLSSCGKELDNIKDLKSHLREHISKGVVITCPYAGCGSTFGSCNQFNVHVSRKHSKAPVTDCISVAPDSIAVDNATMSDENFDSNNTFDVPPAYPETDVGGKIYLENMALFYMKLEFQYLLPASTVQRIAKELNIIKVETYDAICLQLKKSLTRQNVKSETVDLILNDVFSVHKTHLDTLKTEYRRDQYYKNNFQYVHPRRVRLNGNKFFYYISIIETLKKLFLNKSFTVDLEAPESNPNVLKDFTDGQSYKANIFFKNNDKCLRIIIYQDAFELCCAIGPAKNKHKTLGVYLSVGNLPTHLRSRVNNIFLVALCRDKDFDHEKLFRPIVEDLKILETTGLDLPGYGNIKAGLVLIAGDNLGSHVLGGFLRSFSKTKYFCRYCLIDNKSFHSDGGHHLQFPRRTPEQYNQCLLGRNRDEKMGVRLNSIFNELKHYHVCGLGGLPCCIGHDLHEGIAAYDMAWFLCYFMNKGWFTEEQLTSKMNSFPYTKEDRRDKPVPYKFGSQKIAGGAMQIWSFIRLFPLFVVHIVNDWSTKWEDPVWNNYLLLVEIMELLMAPEIHVSAVGYLDSLIHEYLDLRISNFPDVPLRPKHHYLTHYPDFFIEFGPLSKVWTLRFESKHQFFKRSIRYSRNFINVLKSLAVKHELHQAFLRTGALMQLEVEPKLCTDFNSHMYSQDLLRAVQQSGASSYLQECATINIKGTTYQKGSLVVVRQSHYQCNVEMGRICLILFEDNTKVYFLVEVFSTSYEPMTRMFKLRSRLQYECILQSELLTYSTAREYQISGKSYVKMKYGVYS